MVDPKKTPKVVEILKDGIVDPKSICDPKGNDVNICIGKKADDCEPGPPTDFDIFKTTHRLDFTLFVLKRDSDEPAKK